MKANIFSEYGAGWGIKQEKSLNNLVIFR